MDINVEDVMAHVEALRTFDRLPFSDLVLVKDGKPIHVSEETRARWRYIGLSNTCFVKDFLTEGNLTQVLDEYVRDEDC